MSRRILTMILALALTASASACSALGESGGADGSAADDAANEEVVLVTHESFTLPDEVIAKFEADTGLTLNQVPQGDAGQLTNKLVLTKDSPTGDVAFGVDNTFASRALDEGVFAESDVELPSGAEDYALEEGSDALVPVDNGNVCVNIDKEWFAKQQVAPPTSFADLTKPAYKDLFVIPGAPTSSPGMAFLLATIDEYGDAWTGYWEDLMANGAKVVQGWTDAYTVNFTGGGESGDRPIVVSYDSSPAFTVNEDQSRTSTKALLSTCFLQVEYAGVLDGADNPEGGQELLQFLLSKDVQAALPESMYVFPVRDDVQIPTGWAKFAVRPDEPHTVDPGEVSTNRKQWLTDYTEIISR